MTSPGGAQAWGGGGEETPHAPPPSLSLRTRKTAPGAGGESFPARVATCQRPRRTALPGKRRLPDKAPGEGSREPPAEPRGRLPRVPARPRSLRRGEPAAPAGAAEGPRRARCGAGSPPTPHRQTHTHTHSAGRARPFVCRAPASLPTPPVLRPAGAAGAARPPPPYLLRPSARWQAGRRAPPAGSACPAGRSRRPPRPAPARGRFPTSGGGPSRRARPRPHRLPRRRPDRARRPGNTLPPPAPARLRPRAVAPERQV